MDKKPLMLIITDIHLKSSNYEKIIELVKTAVDISLELCVPLVCLGDFFDSRSSQRLDVLLAARDIFKYIHDKNVELIIISGNHDKTKYDSHDSFLDVYEPYKNIRLIRDVEVVDFNDVSVTIMPFFVEEMMVDRIENMSPTDVLLSHFELNGSINNGIVAKDRLITPTILKKFKFVGLGHYHNGHTVEGANVHHFSSIMQSNYGEDEDKGYHILYDDLSHELIKSDFKPFKTLSINLDTMTKEDEKEVLKIAKNNDFNLRVEVSGSIEKVKAFKKDKFVLAGIDVKRKYEDLNTESVNENDYATEAQEIVNTDKEFKKFCTNEGLNYEKGKKYLI